MNKKPITNCHTHIFHIDHVPNEFLKTFLPIGLYKFFTVKRIRNYFLNHTEEGNESIRNKREKRRRQKRKLLADLKTVKLLWWLYICMSIILKPIKQLYLWVKRTILKILNLDKLFSEEFKEVIGRFLAMARYSIRYKDQSSIYLRLKTNYRPSTSYVVLAMDMEYMAAGKCEKDYISYDDGESQIKELLELKIRDKEGLFYPFIGVDPRRMRDNNHGDKFTNETFRLLSEGLMSGIKLYPPIGYYPFDKDLIELYKFAAEKQIPIMTHCSKGVVYYRGKKEAQWSKHPILRYNYKNKNSPFKL